MSTVKATYDGFVGLNGVPVLLNEGDEYDSEHPLVQQHPDMFTEPPTRRQAKQQQQQTPPSKRTSDG